MQIQDNALADVWRNVCAWFGCRRTAVLVAVDVAKIAPLSVVKHEE